MADESSVMMAAMKVGAAQAPGSLYGLVNNAGIGKGSLAELVAVNYFGPKRVRINFHHCHHIINILLYLTHNCHMDEGDASIFATIES